MAGMRSVVEVVSDHLTDRKCAIIEKRMHLLLAKRKKRGRRVLERRYLQSNDCNHTALLLSVF